MSSSQSSTETHSQLSGACALLAVLVQAQCSTQSSAKGDIEHGFERLDELKKQLADSIRQAEEAAHDSGVFGFLGDIFGSDIAQIAGAVAAIAATIATGGAAAPVLLIAISEALQVAATVGAKLGLDPKICFAIGIASVAVGFCSGAGTAQAAGEIAGIARGVSLGAKVAQGGATAVGGAFHFVSASAHARQLDYQADAAGHQAEDHATNLELDDAFARLRRALRVEQHETDSVSAQLRDESDTNSTLSQRI
ncbi:MAG TPA: hypothetical protein VHM25_14705 [Polyangiaceae bacterium]|nr:hypothetical protein [Polyangiaceae bacterium]